MDEDLYNRPVVRKMATDMARRAVKDPVEGAALLRATAITIATAARGCEDPEAVAVSVLEELAANTRFFFENMNSAQAAGRRQH